MSAVPRTSTARFDDREDLLDFLLEVSSVVSETLELDRLLPAVADFIQRVVPHDIFAILLYLEREKGLAIRYARGHRDEIVRSLIIPLGEGITGRAGLRREPVVVNDVLSDPDYLRTLDAVHSELAVPMMARGKLVGVIDLQSTHINAFSEKDVTMLKLLASRAAASIDNARLYRRVINQNRTSRTLALLSQEFSATLDIDKLLSKIAKAVKTLINYDAFSILLVDPTANCLRHRFSERYDQRVVLDNIPIGKGLTGAAAESRETVLVADTAADPRYIPSHPDIRSEMAIPLVLQDRTIGVLDLESERLAYFTEEHKRTMLLLAPQIATSVENARLYEELAQREQRMEQDLKAARNLQSFLLPRSAELPGLETAIQMRPAREITGDLYNFSELDGGKSLIAFGDSSGKGAAAALYGALVGGVLRSFANRARGPAELMKRLNDVLIDRKADVHYVTLLLMVWDATTRTMTVANAGSTPPLLIRKCRPVKTRVEGIPLGLLADREYEEIDVVLEPGDVMVLYSDGIQDQQNNSGDEYGAHLTEVVRRHAGESAMAISEAIWDDVDLFMNGAPMSDDQTVVVLKVI